MPNEISLIIFMKRYKFSMTRKKLFTESWIYEGQLKSSYVIPFFQCFNDRMFKSKMIEIQKRKKRWCGFNFK